MNRKIQLMKDIVVQIQNLKKLYKKYTAVNNISFEVRAGEIFGILGPNGAGKTSTLECIEGLRRPDAGTINICGMNPQTDGKKLKDVLGVQLQSSGLPGTITVKEALKFFASYHHCTPSSELIEQMGLKEKLHKKYGELSGGEKRRLVLALATLHHPQVLILDEPTAALDVQSRVSLHEVMKDLRDSNTAILLATHDMAEAEKLCNRIAIIIKGELVAVGTPKEITAMGSTASKISVRTVGNSLAGMNGKLVDDYYIFSSEIPGEKINEIMARIGENEDTLVDLRVERESLEEKFIQIASKGRC